MLRGLPLSELLASIPTSAAERAVFERTDPASLPLKVSVLVGAAHYVNTLSLTTFGGRLAPVRDKRLVEQVVAAAFQQYGGVDPHPDVFDKSAMLLRGITQGHPFNDGNKRTGFVVSAYFLNLSGIRSPDSLDVDAVVAFSYAVSAGAIRDVDTMSATLRAWWAEPFR